MRTPTITLRTLRTLTNSFLLNRQWRAPPRPFLRTNSSSNAWVTRQKKDHYTKQAKVMDLKSRAAFKLLEIHDAHSIFKAGQTVVDLGYAPGSWSQIAVELTKPSGRILGVDILPAVPPTGVSTIQGNFLSPRVQEYIRDYLSDPERGRPRKQVVFRNEDDEEKGISAEEIEDIQRGYIDRERLQSKGDIGGEKRNGEKIVDVVLSDMWEPWPMLVGGWKRSLTAPYNRLMNTSGAKFRDHAGSMDLCQAALEFCIDVLKPGGSFVCKFYQGAEEGKLEKNLKTVFGKVNRQKPDSSRKESKELYFIALNMRENVTKEMVKREGKGAEAFTAYDPYSCLW